MPFFFLRFRGVFKALSCVFQIFMLQLSYVAFDVRKQAIREFKQRPFLRHVRQPEMTSFVV